MNRRGPPSMSRAELNIHGLRSWGRNWSRKVRESRSSSSQKRSERTGSVGSALKRFSFVLRTSRVWAGSTIPQAPKERQFIAWGRQPQDPETRQKKPFQPRRGDSRAVAEPYCRPDWGLERLGPLGTSWGLRLQGMDFRRYAAGENTDDLQPVNPRLWVACGRCKRKSP